MPSKITLPALVQAQGEIHLPGSKSLTNRALLLAALSHGTTTLYNLLDSDDTRYMRDALRQLGVNMQFSDDFKTCRITGCGGLFQSPANPTLFLGNAGTAMRFLTAALTLKTPMPQSIVLTGEERMQNRPIGHLVDALRQAGADIQYQDKLNYPPLRIKSTGLGGGHIQIDGSISSQFLSALLMVAPFCEQDTHIEIVGELVSKPYIEMTIRMMEIFGVNVEWQGQNLFIKAKQSYQNPENYFVEGDASSASYFLALGALAGKVRVYGIDKNSLQGDATFAEVLAKMGAKITYGDHFIEAEKGELHGVDLDFNAIPDAAMTIATTALFAKGDTYIRNVYNWRVKETDRLSAMATELRKIGATVEEGEDFIHVYPLAENAFQHAEIETYRDHRIAMCFALTSFAGKGITLLDPSCVNKTFPTFFEEWRRITEPT